MYDISLQQLDTTSNLYDLKLKKIDLILYTLLV